MKKICNKSKISKDYLEDIVVRIAREELNLQTIKEISKKVVEECEKSKDNSILKKLNKLLQNNQRKRENLIKAVSECDIDSVRKNIYVELGKLEQSDNELKREILKEENQFTNITEKQVQFFLLQIKNGDIQDIKYKRMLINILVNKVLLFENHVIVVFNMKDKQMKIDFDTEQNIKKVLLKGDALHHKSFT